MQFLSFIVQHFYSLDYESFTKKYLAAMQVMEALKKQAEMHKGDNQNLVKKEEIEKIKWYGENTDQKVRVSIAELDRCINPTKGRFYMNDNKRRFKRNDYLERREEGKDEEVELTDMQMQYYLVNSLLDISLIVVRNIMLYNEEYPMDFETEDNFDIKDFIGGKKNEQKKVHS